MSPQLQQLLAAFARLIEEHDDEAEDTSEGIDNFRCEDCVRCSNCRFCTACEDCDDCTYCDACMECRRCTQSRECLGCVGTTHSVHCGYCRGGSYLTLCYDCDDCVQCFACVALTGAEFCLLNRRLSRRDYFKKVAELRAELDVLAVEGWFPPWIEGGELPEAEPEPPEAGPDEPDAPPPYAAVDPRSPLSSLAAALDNLELETEPLDPGGLFDAMSSGPSRNAVRPSSVAAPAFPPFQGARSDFSAVPPVVPPIGERPPAAPERPAAAAPAPAEHEPTREERSDEAPRLLTRGVRPPRRASRSR